MPKVSVIVPNYNHARFLRQRIDTILAQTFQDFELILLDDASTDDSRSILSSYSGNPHVRAVEFNEKNSGSTFKQWNKGVRLAHGECVWIAESDDYADPRFLERLVPVLDAKPQVVFVSCRSWQIDADGNVTGYADSTVPHWARYERGAEVDGREECQTYFVRTTTICNASSVLFRRAAYEQAGGADETLRFCGDRKMWAAMALTGRIAFISEPLNYYRVHGNTVTAKSTEQALFHAEYLRVSRWMLGKVTPSPPAPETLRGDLPPFWTPAVTFRRVPLDRRISILRDAIAIDRRVAWQIVPAGLSALRRKFWRPVWRFVRELWAWSRTEQFAFPTVSQLTSSIAAISACGTSGVSPPGDPESPIFLLSTGMRTGSTLLQRILVTDPRLLLWGEPLGELAVVSRIAEMLSDSLSPDFLRSWQNQPSPASPELAKSWIAHLHPSSDDFRLALRSLFDTWLGQPARRHGFARWGLKAIRESAADAILLHWLYPNAKFILLTRHPYDSYRSFADAGTPLHFVRHPHLLINSAARFAREWNRIAVSWSELPPEFPCLRVKYEELISGAFDFRKFESWLGVNLKEDQALSVSVGRTAFRARLRSYERWIVAREAAAGMRALGYSNSPVNGNPR